VFASADVIHSYSDGMPDNPADSTSDLGKRPGAWQEWEIAELRRRRAAIDYLNRHAPAIYRPEKQDEAPPAEDSSAPAS